MSDVIVRDSPPRALRYRCAAPMVTMVRVPTLLRPLAAVAAALLALSACRDTNAPPEPVATIRLSTDSAVVHVDSTVQLSAEVLDAAGRPVDGRPVAWFVFDTSIAAVDSTGRLRGVAVGATSLAVASESALVRVPVVVVVGLAGVSTGYGSCALSPAGRPYCWAPGSSPRVVTGAPPLTAAFAGSLSCGLSASGGAWCWGSGGPLGDGGDTGSAVAVEVQGGHAFVGLTASHGQSFICGLTSAGEAFCWGRRSPAFSVPFETLTVPQRIAAPLLFRRLSAGHDSACGITLAGETYCWGENRYGQLGSHVGWDACPSWDVVCTTTPTLAPAVPPLSTIASGQYFVCGLTPSGEAYCWGDDRYGQLGDTASAGCYYWGSVGPCSESPVKVSGGLRFVSLSAGDFHACGLTVGGEAWCWGDNRYGQLGDPAAGAWSAAPVRAGGDLLFRSLSAGWGTCGVATDGLVYCFDATRGAVRVPFQP